MAGESIAAKSVVTERRLVAVPERRSVSAQRGLSAQLLLMTVAFVFLGEALIFIPSVAAERRAYLDARIRDADLATVSLEETPNNMVSEQLARRLLDIAGVRAIVYRSGQTRRLVLAEALPQSLDFTYDLRQVTWLGGLADAFETLLQDDNRVMRLIGPSRQSEGALVEVVMDEAPMAAQLRAVSIDILGSTAVISTLAAGLLFLALQWRLVQPMGRITRSMVDFHESPADPRSVIEPSQRRDEIGLAERELAAMQTDLRASLRQSWRLAQLGTAVSKINHDLRNILATAMLLSDRIALIEDPEVQRLTPPLVKSIDRALALCNDTLRFGRADEPLPKMADFDLADLIDDVTTFASSGAECGICMSNKVKAPFLVHADREQLFRALLNLARNATEAMEGLDGPNPRLLTFSAERLGTCVTIDISDTGPGLPDMVRASLFKPFTNGGAGRGTGLGLAITRDVARSHGGDIELVGSNTEGTHFRMEFPHA